MSDNQRPIAILFLNHASAVLGAERGLLDLIGVLDPARYRSIVVLPQSGQLGPLLEKRGARVMALPLLRFCKTWNPLRLAAYAWSLVRVVPALVRLIRRERVDIVHSNSTTAHIYGGLAATIAHKPCIWHCRDLVELGPLAPSLTRRATVIVAISEAVRQHLSARVGAAQQKIRLIRNGTDVTEFRPRPDGPAVRSELGIKPDRFVVAMAGQLIPWKRHGLFLRAAALIASEVPSAAFLIAGADVFRDDSGYETELRALARALRLEQSVVFAGYRDDMPKLLAAVDVLVHPADKEPLGRIVLEAMAAGKPVVAVDACGPAEVIRNGTDGLLVPPESPRAIADAVLRLARDRAWAAALASAARQRVERDFSLAGYVAQIEQVYADLYSAACATERTAADAHSA